MYGTQTVVSNKMWAVIMEKKIIMFRPSFDWLDFNTRLSEERKWNRNISDEKYLKLCLVHIASSKQKRIVMKQLRPPVHWTFLASSTIVKIDSKTVPGCLVIPYLSWGHHQVTLWWSIRQLTEFHFQYWHKPTFAGSTFCLFTTLYTLGEPFSVIIRM